MTEIPEKVLISEIRKRFREKDRMLLELRKVMKVLEGVNKKLEDSERLKSNFISNIKNEINNPLASIMSLAGVLRNEAALEISDVRSIAKYIYEDSFNLDFQLRNIFAAADIEAGEAAICLSSINITDLVRETVSSFHHQIAEKKLDTEFNDWTGKDSLFTTDPDKLRLIVSNFLSNAIKFSPSSSTIKLTVSMSDRFVNISVNNTGPEIKGDDLSRIFDRFVQLDTGSTRHYSGQGLGLSIARAYAELLYGHIVVCSDKDKGNTFTLVVPEILKSSESGVVPAGNELFFFNEEERF